MSRDFTEISDDPPLPLSALRLMVPPLRLICAAIWQTLQQNVLTDYEMLEEFVIRVTAIVPGLVHPKLRAQLILGLRAKVWKSDIILELCRSEVTANLQNIQPHLDRLLTLVPLLGIEKNRHNHTCPIQTDPSYSAPIFVKTASSKRKGKLCDLCNKEIEGNMRDHKMKHRRAAAEAGAVVHCVKCDECDKAFECKMSLRAHKVTHNRLYCEVCTRMVRDSNTLEKHRMTHTPFQCNMCKENFRLLKHLVTHYEDLHKLSEPYVCAYCQESCKTLKHLIKHEWKHTGHQPFKCLYCPKKIRSYADLTEHERVHTKEQPFLCWTCGTGFKHKHTLEKHVVRCQNLPSQSKKAYICTHCGNSYKDKRGLLSHEQTLHKGVRYPCTYCGKGFFSPFALVRHILIHTGERPYKCTYGDCNKSFRSPSEVRVHTCYHTGERPYKCHFCGKGFVQACSRTLHIRSHTGEKPYPCSVCDKRFNSFHGLKRHKNIHA
ncbi:uncharacterized protein FYW47_015003 [Aplochiton taeniatus]